MAPDSPATEPGRPGRTVRLPVGSLLSSDSPRVAGVDEAHVRVLAELVPDLPPILVHRGSNRVIDGMHRLRAHWLRGFEHIEAEYYDGPDAEIFIVAVRTNLYHGLPLSLADRRSAARRILEQHSDFSDRGIAAIVGLSAKTIGRLRQPDSGGDDTFRLGRDGRVRPLGIASARKLAGELLQQNPQASLRGIGREARR